jgi:hypothetical protein
MRCGDASNRATLESVSAVDRELEERCRDDNIATEVNFDGDIG